MKILLMDQGEREAGVILREMAGLDQDLEETDQDLEPFTKTEEWTGHQDITQVYGERHL